ncbi:MAG: 30S ribosomal protein S3 [Desulfobacterales bacterium]|nr:30S ribosomal protein S3 [Desulfobacterales bacterium]
MGQKVNPIGLRIGIVKTWESRWYAEKNYSKFIVEDYKLREFVKKKLSHAGISKIEIERSDKRIRLVIYAAKPGIIIGKKGAEIDLLKRDIEKLLLRKTLEKTATNEVSIDIQEVKKIEIDAKLVAENVGNQLLRRVAFRRAMKKCVVSAIKSGAKGIKIICSGRLGGAEMARTEWYKEGRIPLHTLRADIDYGVTEAKTTYGMIGIKVFIFKGEKLADNKRLSE